MFKNILRQIARLQTIRHRTLISALLMVMPAISAWSATVTYPLQFSTGWNLAGNSLSTPMDVKTTLGNQTNILSVWKWVAAESKWAFYSPSLDASGSLTGYLNSNGYSLLSTINPGEGFWVNASAPVVLGNQSGTGFNLSATNLVKGWNLATTAEQTTPTSFSDKVGNVSTIWAWDTANSAWYFHSPALAASGTQPSYLLSKGYKDFATLTLASGMGFWINYAGTVESSSFSLASDAGVDGGTLPVEYTCDGLGVSPALSWSNAPTGTKEFALMMTTIPVDGATKWNWVMYGIPGSTNKLARSSSGVGIAGAGSHGATLAYEPPCSQGPGAKFYTFTVYALSASPALPTAAEQVTGEVLSKAISSVTLGSATLTFSYARP